MGQTDGTGKSDGAGQTNGTGKSDGADVVQTGIGKVPTAVPEPGAELLKEAKRLAAMYDYDKAISLLQKAERYASDEQLNTTVAGFREQKAACRVWEDNSKISHCFFHSLIADTSLAFGPDSGTLDGYNRYMTTTSEFERILEQMHEKGYVLVRMHDIAELVKQDDGTEVMQWKPIILPPGKTPFVMSQDDVNYYDYMDGEGFANKIVIGKDGKPTCEYIKKDGTVVTGEYDLVPILNRFIEEHPDFSYRGAKAILAITGYEGTLGYETAPYRYKSTDKVTLFEKKLSQLSEKEKEAMLEDEKAACIKVVEVLRADGYEFACHSYAHGNMQTCTDSKYQSDTDRWKREVGSLLGETDIYIFPFGADICDWRGYHGEKYEYSIKSGFHYFCNVDSALYWVQMKNDYLRQGRINFDGERMMCDPEKLTYFFDVDTVLDSKRPYRVTR